MASGRQRPSQLVLAGEGDTAYWGDLVAPAAQWPALRRSMAPGKTREYLVDLKPWYSKKVNDALSLIVGEW